MSGASSSVYALSSRVSFPIILLSLLTVASITTSCGSSGSASSKTPTFTGNTSVTVMVSGTANDQLSEFDLGFQGITLTSQSGKTATLLSLAKSAPALGAEFMHINGTAEPLVTASIPQDVYTSATVSMGGAEIVCVALGSVAGQEELTEDFYNLLPLPATATVTFPSPITVSGTSMGLSLDLAGSQSATLGNCLSPNGFAGFSITPTFNITPITLSPSPTNSSNGKVTGFDGQITAVVAGENSFTLTTPDLDGSRSFTVGSNNSTVYQGVSGFSTLAVGAFVDLDGAMQSDGSLLATRIAVEDPSAQDVVRGPLIQVAQSVSDLVIRAREQQGKDFPGYIGGFGPFAYSNASFAISGQLANLGNLPFVPSFDASNMVPGQEVYISAASIPTSGYPNATTTTLMPQIINGTVTASSAVGTFMDYTVSLASYDLFPMLAGQPGQTSVENNPGQIEVYVDSNTQQLNTTALATGSTLRFYGLVFNDNGTLRMDCAQVSDGVAFSSPSMNSQPGMGQVQTTRREGPGGVIQTVNTVTHSH